jgi:hypothetical protein
MSLSTPVHRGPAHPVRRDQPAGDAWRGAGILQVVDLIDVSTRVPWPAYVGLGLLGALLVSVVVAPDRWWRLERSFVGWQYRDGHRIELSRAGRIAARSSAVVTTAALCLIAGATVDWTAERRVRTEWLRPAGTVYDVGDAVESPGCVVRVFACLRAETVFPVGVTEYRALTGRRAGIDGVPDDADLLLYVEGRYFPTHLVVEEGERVTVTLYGRCARPRSGEAYGRSRSDCAADPRAALNDPGAVPVRLAEPLGERTLIDGHSGMPVEPRR